MKPSRTGKFPAIPSGRIRVRGDLGAGISWGEKKRLELQFPLWNTLWTDHSSTSGRTPMPVLSLALLDQAKDFGSAYKLEL